MRLTLELLKAAVQSGGTVSLEHPRDRGCHPFPTIWTLPEVAALEGTQRTVRQLPFRRVSVDQCMLGAEVEGQLTRKATELQSN